MLKLILLSLKAMGNMGQSLQVIFRQRIYSVRSIHDHVLDAKYMSVSVNAENIILV